MIPRAFWKAEPKGQEVEAIMMSFLPSRAVLDRLFALGGAVIIFAEFYTLDASPFHIPVIALGILMIYIGTWRMAGRLLHKRTNKALRAEVDHFIALVRQLCAQRKRDDAARVTEAEAELRGSFERIISAAGSDEAKASS